MHTLVIMNKNDYHTNLRKLVVGADKQYNKACYISFNDPYHIIVNMLENVQVTKDKFFVIDASNNPQESKIIDKSTFIVPVKTLFNVYVFLRDMIQEEGIELLLLDSISMLIEKYPDLDLKTMLTNLLLEVGSFKCDSSLVVFHEHKDHEVVSHVAPFISKSIVLYN